MRLTATADAHEFAVKLANLKRVTPEGMKIVLGQSAGRIGIRLARLTWPKTVESERVAIARDSSARVWRPLSALLKEAKQRGKAWVAAVVMEALKKDAKKAVEAAFMKAGMRVKIANRAEPKRHLDLRTKTDAVVRRGNDDVLVRDRSKVDQFAERLAKQQAGNAAAGWLAASRQLRKPRSSDYVPDFKKRLSRRNTGTSWFTGEGTPNMTATISNRVRYIRRPFNGQMVKIASEFEAQTIAKQMRVLVRKGYAKQAQVSSITDLYE